MKYKVTIEDKVYEIDVEPVSEEPLASKTLGKYPSSHVLLEVAKDEYTKERERTNSLDNKAGVFIAAIIAMITVFIPVIPFNGVVEKYSSGCRTDFITVSLCSLGLALILLIISFYNLYKAISTKAFKRPQINDLHDIEILNQECNVTEKGLIEHYSTIIFNNQGINEQKVYSLNIGLGFSLVGFLILAASAISLQILV